VITLAAEGKAGTDSSNASASTDKTNAAAAGSFQNGVAVFTIVKGGLMAGISVSGQKFKYKPIGH
jgi:lipid-binding SYLF domain-containing protein